MAIHLCRDYPTQNNNGNNAQVAAKGQIPLYLMALFARRVLGWSVVGQTNFDLNTVGGTFLIATGDTTPTGSTPTWGPSTLASAFTDGYQYISIPSGVHTVSSANIGKIMVTKSASNPTFNSGCFVITGIDTPGNRYQIDWRSNDTPPIENSSLQWYIYASDANAPQTNGTNNTQSAGTYRSFGNSTNARIILQSPHASAYQVRLCAETATDAGAGFCPVWTVAPGFGGNSAGDFAVGGQHLHGLLFYNVDNSSVFATALGGGNRFTGAATGGQVRITMCGDDTGQFISSFERVPSGSSYNHNLVCFGIPDNEPTPAPINNIERLFCFGSMGQGNSTGNALNGITWATSSTTSNNMFGVSFSQGGIPIACVPSSWMFVSGNAIGAGPYTSGTAGDCPFVGATELLTVDIISGTISSWGVASTIQGQFAFEPRIMGSVPQLRQGRTNFGNWTVTTDAGHAYQHMLNGVFIPWSGPNPLP